MLRHVCLAVRLRASSSSGYLSRRPLSTADLDDFKAVNEPVREYKLGSTDRERLEKRLAYYSNTCVDIPIVIGDEEYHTNDVQYQVMPFDHSKKVARFSYADKELIQKAVDTAVQAQRSWEKQPFEKRAEVFLKAAQFMQEEYRMDLMATSMLGQAKTIIQAEIDAACELIDFINFNTQFGWQVTRYQPISVQDIENRMFYRGLEGFWAAVTPFNFTAIGGNLASAPAIAGNTTVWKPSDAAMLSNYTVFRIFREAGLPGGIVNFVPADGPVFGDMTGLSGLKFLGTLFVDSEFAKTFERLWKQVGQNISNYTGFPRMIGECGGKNFHLVHTSADYETVVNATLRSAFEFGGQKCSACSRLFLPKSCSKEILDRLVEGQKKLKLGSPLEVDTFLSAVIDSKSFARCKSYLEHAKSSSDCQVLAGGSCDDSKGYFVEPTIVLCNNPSDKLLTEEIFGPILSVYVYNDSETDQILKHINTSTPYALTGAIFAQDEVVKSEWSDFFRYSAGNFYVNDKSTGSVVGQQPFGGARKSGTNDKAGGPHYMLKFLSPLAVKTNTAPLKDLIYPYMKE